MRKGANMPKCPECGKTINENEILAFLGTATVHGDTSIAKFREEGIVWAVNDSEDEAVICPHCHEPIPLSKLT